MASRSGNPETRQIPRAEVPGLSTFRFPLLPGVSGFEERAPRDDREAQWPTAAEIPKRGRFRGRRFRGFPLSASHVLLVEFLHHRRQNPACHMLRCIDGDPRAGSLPHGQSGAAQRVLVKGSFRQAREDRDDLDVVRRQARCAPCRRAY